ncbi:glycosyltransferase family 2 protein [Salinimonas lutimaris]|uniref:glycosyltransferase family 2 protein n=1 Tax=Salinimonas lutimaris TaxID=914153 RepID=UPI001586366A|nr:glycosyltransferase [Salinimonas lutimaris]
MAEQVHTDILVSVVMPCYNYASYIAESVASVKAQTETRWELIIVNDGSTDNTEQVLKAYEDDPKITVVNKANGGVSSARNYALQQAQGKYIAFLDADDIWHPEKLARVVGEMQKHKAVFGSSDFTRFSKNSDNFGHFLDYCRQLNHLKGTQEAVVYAEPLSVFCSSLEMPWYPSANIVQASACKGLLFDESMKLGEDLDFFLKLWSLGPAVFVPQPLLKLRVHDSNASKASTNHPLLVAQRFARHRLWLSHRDDSLHLRKALALREAMILGMRDLLGTDAPLSQQDKVWLKQQYRQWLFKKGLSVTQRLKLIYNALYLSLGKA